MDTNEAMALLDSGSAAPPASTDSGGAGMALAPLAPRTAAALDAASSKERATAAMGGMSRGEVAGERFIAENQIPGVPLDIESGTSGWDRFMLSFRREQQNQVKFLEDKYGPGTVRLSGEGDLIVRAPDPSNPEKSKDILVDPKGKMSVDDFLSVLSIAPEIGGWVWAERAAKLLPKVGKVKGVAGATRDILAGSVGAEAAGTIKDVAFSVYDRQTLDLPETLAERGKMAGVDAAVGAVSKPAAAFFQWLKNPAHGYRGQVQFDAIEAQKYFKTKYGVDVPLTVGESTGMPLASRSEVFIEKMPGGSEPIREVKRQQESAFRKLQRIMIGEVPPTDEEIGQAAINQIRSKVEPAIASVESATAGLSTASQDKIAGIISGVTLPEREILKTALGKDLRTAVVGRRNAVQEEADKLYGAVKSLPGGEGKVFSAAGLQADFQKIKDALPSPEKIVERPSPLVDATGREIKSTSKEVATMREFVPPNVLSRLESVIGLKGAKFSLSDLQQMRREVYDDIAKGEGVPGLGTHYLADIGKALTKAIDDGVSALPSGDLKSALSAANEHYKTKVIPFNRQGLTELFRNADEVGHVSDSEVVSRLLGGSKAQRNWDLMKETLGETSAEFNRMRRSVADNVLESSRLPGEEIIDAKSFSKNLHQFSIQHPEMYADVFKGSERELFRQAKFLGYAQGDKIDANDLKKLLSDPNPTADKLRTLVAAEKKRDELYKNQLVKAIGSGNITDQTLKPSEFVNRVLESSEPKDVTAIMGMLSDKPELLQSLRQKTFEKVFRDAARSATAGDVNRIISGESTHILSGIKIADALKNTSYRDKIKSILGPEGWDDLQQYIKLQIAPEAKESSFRAAGGLAAGAQIANLERRGLFAYMTDSARNFIFATVLSKPPLRTWLTRMPEEPGKWSLILSSPPFLEAVTKEFGEGSGAEAFMSNVKRALDQSFTGQSGQQQDGTTQKPAGDPVEFGDKRKYWETQLDAQPPAPTKAN